MLLLAVLLVLGAVTIIVAVLLADRSVSVVPTPPTPPVPTATTTPPVVAVNEVFMETENFSLQYPAPTDKAYWASDGWVYSLAPGDVEFVVRFIAPFNTDSIRLRFQRTPAIAGNPGSLFISVWENVLTTPAQISGTCTELPLTAVDTTVGEVVFTPDTPIPANTEFSVALELRDVVDVAATTNLGNSSNLYVSGFYSN